MATFKALNIESDDEEDVEIDNTKEIQVEEALKLYQDALKLHSEGPSSYDQAAAAYKALFESEIFQYPESQSELRRVELYGSQSETLSIDPSGSQSDLHPFDSYGPQADFQGQEGLFQEYQEDVTTGYTVPTEENALGTLPQLIHLAQKNYGQFLLESLQYKIKQATRLSTSDQAPQVSSDDITKASLAALDSIVESLDKDDTDPDLWRKAAVVGDLLGSRRIARYCLEAVLEADDAGVEAVLSSPGLAETMAAQQLRLAVLKLRDDLSLLQSPLSHIKKLSLIHI